MILDVLRIYAYIALPRLPLCIFNIHITVLRGFRNFCNHGNFHKICLLERNILIVCEISF